MEVYAIDDLYKRCFEKYSLARKDFCTLEDFYETFQINDQQTVINLLNITYAEEDRVRSKELWEIIHKLDDNEIYNSDFQKDRIEFRALGFLLLIYPHLHFQKSEKPDFILRLEDKKIGLEITSAVSNIEAQLNKVIKFTFGRNKRTEEKKEYIAKKHPNIVGKHGIYDINGTTVLSPTKGSVDSSAYRNKILGAALKKAKIVKEYTSFSEMWVLINTEDNLCFTEEHDAENLAKLFISKNLNLAGINKIVVINILNRAFMIYDVGCLEFKFAKCA